MRQRGRCRGPNPLGGVLGSGTAALPRGLPAGAVGGGAQLHRHRRGVFKTQRYLLLEQVSDPGNVGTILRTAAALGLGGILLDSGCADCLGDKAVRASMGSIFKLPVYRVDSAPDTVAWLKRQGLPVYGSTLSCRSVDIGQVDLRAPCAVVIGNEGRGITEPTAAACDQLVHIPITPAAESLNAAAAAAIFSWEMMR